MLTFFRRLFCRHRCLSWVRTLHGDEIISHGYRRTVMICDDCGKVLYLDDYITREMAISIYQGDQLL